MDDETLAARVATGKGGSNWFSSRDAREKKRSATETWEAEIKEDADAFAAKLYPAGRILHLVLARRASEEAERDARRTRPNDERTGGASPSEPEGTRRYELYADVSVEAYDRIRLSKTMLSDHFLPKYIEALEDVRARWEVEKRGTRRHAERLRARGV